jgi:DNA polymerase III delta prime subunit
MLRPGLQFHQPNSLEDLDCNDFIKNKLVFFKNNSFVPNLLISGPPGSGKTTAGK